jgi:hypothetical protein
MLMGHIYFQSYQTHAHTLRGAACRASKCSVVTLYTHTATTMLWRVIHYFTQTTTYNFYETERQTELLETHSKIIRQGWWSDDEHCGSRNTIGVSVHEMGQPEAANTQTNIMGNIWYCRDCLWHDPHNTVDVPLIRQGSHHCGGNTGGPIGLTTQPLCGPVRILYT